MGSPDRASVGGNQALIGPADGICSRGTGIGHGPTPDDAGRRRVLVLSSLLVVIAGVVFALTDSLPLLILAGVVGVISPTGNEVGPFLAVEQASLSEVVPARRRTAVFAWYNLAGYLATATG